MVVSSICMAWEIFITVITIIDLTFRGPMDISHPVWAFLINHGEPGWVAEIIWQIFVTRIRWIMRIAVIVALIFAVKVEF